MFCCWRPSNVKVKSLSNEEVICIKCKANKNIITLACKHTYCVKCYNISRYLCKECEKK
jgi:hypothetical protein